MERSQPESYLCIHGLNVHSCTICHNQWQSLTHTPGVPNPLLQPTSVQTPQGHAIGMYPTSSNQDEPRDQTSEDAQEQHILTILTGQNPAATAFPAVDPVLMHPQIPSHGIAPPTYQQAQMQTHAQLQPSHGQVSAIPMQQTRQPQYSQFVGPQAYQTHGSHYQPQAQFQPFLQYQLPATQTQQVVPPSYPQHQPQVQTPGMASQQGQQPQYPQCYPQTQANPQMYQGYPSGIPSQPAQQPQYFQHQPQTQHLHAQTQYPWYQSQPYPAPVYQGQQYQYQYPYGQLPQQTPQQPAQNIQHVSPQQAQQAVQPSIPSEARPYASSSRNEHMAISPNNDRNQVPLQAKAPLSQEDIARIFDTPEIRRLKEESETRPLYWMDGSLRRPGISKPPVKPPASGEVDTLSKTQASSGEKPSSIPTTASGRNTSGSTSHIKSAPSPEEVFNAPGDAKGEKDLSEGAEMPREVKPVLTSALKHSTDRTINKTHASNETTMYQLRLKIWEGLICGMPGCGQEHPNGECQKDVLQKHWEILVPIKSYPPADQHCRECFELGRSATTAATHTTEEHDRCRYYDHPDNPIIVGELAHYYNPLPGIAGGDLRLDVPPITVLRERFQQRDIGMVTRWQERIRDEIKDSPQQSQDVQTVRKRADNWQEQVLNLNGQTRSVSYLMHPDTIAQTQEEQRIVTVCRKVNDKLPPAEWTNGDDKLPSYRYIQSLKPHASADEWSQLEQLSKIWFTDLQDKPGDTESILRKKASDRKQLAAKIMFGLKEIEPEAGT